MNILFCTQNLTIAHGNLHFALTYDYEGKENYLLTGIKGVTIGPAGPKDVTPVYVMRNTKGFLTGTYGADNAHRADPTSEGYTPEFVFFNNDSEGRILSKMHVPMSDPLTLQQQIAEVMFYGPNGLCFATYAEVDDPRNARLRVMARQMNSTRGAWPPALWGCQRSNSFAF